MFILQNHYTLFGIFCKELYDDKCRIIYKQLGLYVMQGRAMLAPTNYNIQKRDDLSVIAENVNPGNITESSLKNIIILRAPKTFSFRQRYDPPFIKAKISIKLLNRRICGVAAATICAPPRFPSPLDKSTQDRRGGALQPADTYRKPG